MLKLIFLTDNVSSSSSEHGWPYQGRFWGHGDHGRSMVDPERLEDDPSGRQRGQECDQDQHDGPHNLKDKVLGNNNSSQ